ncbi:DNA-directed RNA polymerase subunit beta [Paenibacillus sp. MZ04-78.2]|uniref:DNA-directed RNA polymerase subunit beta n=1 Tax=Paenibacillus sp. MZ04-78.2 TaxID=2962034 RepID=UPI0028153A52|nr:DNA-directed RNA polymerase subunit beta [Paenibacillus sp. MZ04-78.2]
MANGITQSEVGNLSDNRKKAPAESKRWKKAVFTLWTWIPFTCIVALLVGLAIGYVYIGKQDFQEVFNLNTWRHAYDLIFADT